MRTLYRMLATITVVGVCVSLSLAQEKAEGKKAPAQSKQTKAEGKKPGAGQAPAGGQGMPMAVKPSPEMQKLVKMFAGTWDTTEKHEPSEYFTQGGTGTGTDTTKAGPGGNSLIGDYRSKGAMGSFTGHGVIYWDAKRKVYSSVWCDSMSPEGCEVGATGKWEGNDLVFVAEGEMMGKKYQMKQVYTDIKPDSFTFHIDTSESGAPMKRMMTIQYARKSATKPPAAPAK